MLDNSLKDIPAYTGSYEYESLSGRHYRTISLIKKFNNGNSLIDVGCNTGILLSAIKKDIPQLSILKGIDLDSNAIKVGIKKHSLNLEHIDLRNVCERYDNIVLCHTLEHIPDLKKIFTKIDDILTPGGCVYISIPNVKSLNATLSLRAWKALSPFFHIWYFDKSSLVKCCKTFLPNYTVVYQSTYFIWSPFYYSTPLWNITKKIMPFVVKKMEDTYLGDQLDIIIQKPK
jgi:ubiquinone/menaquinone biosynthesis C-methylase UbiE